MRKYANMVSGYNLAIEVLSLIRIKTESYMWNTELKCHVLLKQMQENNTVLISRLAKDHLFQHCKEKKDDVTFHRFSIT